METFAARLEIATPANVPTLNDRDAEHSAGLPVEWTGRAIGKGGRDIIDYKTQACRGSCLYSFLKGSVLPALHCAGENVKKAWTLLSVSVEAGPRTVERT